MGATDTREDQVPIKGYDRMDTSELFAELRLCSQVELCQVEGYERAHQDRGPILDKLRYLRTREPVEGYDAMEPDEILEEYKDADIPKLHEARGYEAKLRHRPEVLDGLVELRRSRRAGDGTGEEDRDAPEPYEAPRGNPVMRLVSSMGATVLVIFAGILITISAFILAIVILSAVAPNALN